MMHNIIVYIFGRPGVGKYTIAKALCENSKYKFILCDNHLINNPIFGLLNDNIHESPPEFAWDCIDRIRNIVFEFIEYMQCTHNANYVLTNCLFDDDGDRELYDSVLQMSVQSQALFIPVKLMISHEEHVRRITNPDRSPRYKSVDTKHVYDAISILNIEHNNLLTLDVTDLSACDVAVLINDYIATKLQNV